jgi:hypothetical protein
VADDLTWTALEDDSFDELRALAHACLDADGGMPLFIGEQMLRGRMLIGESIAARDASGALVAAPRSPSAIPALSPPAWCTPHAAVRGWAGGCCSGHAIGLVARR